MKVRLMALLFGFSLIVGLPLVASAGPATGGSDSDLDGVLNAFDNCLLVGNADQADANHDGCGDACTAPITCDANGDTAVGAPDVTIFLATFGNDCRPGKNPGPGGDCRSDCTNDNAVGAPDVTAFVGEFGNLVGASGITTAQCQPGLCQCTPQ